MESFAEKANEKGGVDQDAKEKEEEAAAAAKKKATERVELLDGKTLRDTGIAFKRFRCVPAGGSCASDYTDHMSCTLLSCVIKGGQGVMRGSPCPGSQVTILLCFATPPTG